MAAEEREQAVPDSRSRDPARALVGEIVKSLRPSLKVEHGGILAHQGPLVELGRGYQPRIARFETRVIRSGRPTFAGDMPGLSRAERRRQLGSDW